MDKQNKNIILSIDLLIVCEFQIYSHLRNKQQDLRLSSQQHKVCYYHVLNNLLKQKITVSMYSMNDIIKRPKISTFNLNSCKTKCVARIR